MKILKVFGVSWLIAIPLLSSCHKGGGTVIHGNLSYNASEVFGEGTPALALVQAAGRGDTKEFNRQIAAGANVNTTGQHGITPLWWAAWAENYEGFTALLDKGADPNAQRAEGYPIMYLIADREDSRFLKAALKHGGDPNLRDSKSGETPLFPAVLHDYKQSIDLLLAAKADVNARMSITEMTLPMNAMVRGDYRLVYRLLEMGADPAAKTKLGQTLADIIETASVYASNNDDPWRAKVIDFMRSKGITMHIPARK